MILSHFLSFAFVTSLHISQNLQITKPNSALKQSSKNDIVLIKRKIHDIRILSLSFNFQKVHKCKFIIIDSNKIAYSLKKIVFLLFTYIDYLFYWIKSTSINHIDDFVLIRYFWICWWDDLILLELFVFVIWFLYPSYVFDYVLCEFRPLEMPISIYIDSLEKFD